MKKESREPNHRQVKTHGFLDAKSRLNIIRITGKRDDIFQYDIQKGLNSVNFFIKHSYVFFKQNLPWSRPLCNEEKMLEIDRNLSAVAM